MGAELVGPLQRVPFGGWFRGGWVIRWYDLPRDTTDIRFRACMDHRVACDCREAALAEELHERAMCMEQTAREVEDARDRVLAGHPTVVWDERGNLDTTNCCQCHGCQLYREYRYGWILRPIERVRDGF